MDDYKIALGALLDANAKGDINEQLNAIKDLSVTISKATLSNDVINDIKRQLTQNGIDLKLVFGNVGQITSQAKQTGQQIGQQINQGISQSINNSTGLLNTFKLSLQNIGMGSEEIDAVANRINNLGVQIESLNQSKSHSIGKNGKDILSVDISGTDSLGQAIKLTEQYNIATGELIRSMDAVSTAQQKSSANTSSFVKQQSQAVSNLTNQINQLNRSAIDQNASRPISDATHLNNLSTAYNDIISAINKMGNASSNAFTTEKNNVKTLISDFKSLVSEYRNAENVSIKMKGTDITSGIAIATNDFEKFKAEAKDFPQITQTINNLNSAISNVADASSLNSFNDQLRIARSELSKIKSETSTLNKEEKVGINISNLKAQISDLQRISPEIQKFEANINGAKVTVQSLLADLNNVNTQSDFSVVNSKWKAFTSSAKSAGIAIEEVSNKSHSIAEKTKKIELSTDVTKLTTDYQKFGVVSQEVESNLKELKLAHDAVINSKGTDKLATEIERYDIALKKAKSSWEELQTTQVSLNQRTSQMTAMQEWMRKNKAATKLCGDQVEKLIQECKTCDKVRFEGIKNEFKQIQVEAGKAGKLGNSFFGGLIDQVKKFTQWIGVTGAVMAIGNVLRNEIKNIKDLDTTLVDLKKTTNATSSELKDFYYSANDTAKQLGVSTEEVINATSAWSRLGYAIKDASIMAENSAILASISPEMNIEEATDGLVSVLKAFKIEAEDSLDGVISKINIIGNTQAVDNNDIVDILTRSSSAMASANNSLEQTIALGTAA